MLSRAVGLVAIDQSDSYISEVLLRRWPEATEVQVKRIIELAREGVAFARTVDWSAPNAKINLAAAPRLPRR